MQGAHHLRQDRPAEVQGPRSSRTTSTPSTSAAAPTASRPRPRPTSARTSPSSPSARARCWPSVVRGRRYYDPALGAQQKAERQGAGRLRPRRHGQRGLADPGRARQGRPFPKVLAAKARHKRAPGRSATSPTHVQQELRTKLKLTDAEHRPRRPADHHDDRQARPRTRRSQAVQDDLPTGPGTSDAAGRARVAIKPGDGAIVAMYGGADFRRASSTRPPTRRMQAGSTFKPFALIAGAGAGRSARHDPSTATARSGSPSSEQATRARAQLRRRAVRQHRPAARATAHSVNTVFARLNIEVGADKTREAAIAAGLPANTARPGGQPLQRLRYGEPARHRHGQRLRDDRGQGDAGDAVPGQEGDQRGRLGRTTRPRSRPRSPSTRTWPSTPPRR